MKLKFSLLFFSFVMYLCSCAPAGSTNTATPLPDSTLHAIVAKAIVVQNNTTHAKDVQTINDSVQTIKDSIKKTATAIRKFTKIDARTYSVEVIISDVTDPKSFKKLSEKLPEGYTVDVDTVATPFIHFKPGELKYVWVDNYERNFSVTYTLKIPKHKKLIRDYEGTFAYIDNNAKVSVNVQSTE